MCATVYKDNYDTLWPDFPYFLGPISGEENQKEAR